MSSFGEALVAAVTRAGDYAKNDQAAPAAILWPDPEREWEPLVPYLRARLPLLTYGDYDGDPDIRSGPAIWLRCMIDRTLPEDPLPETATPVIYLPGVTREALEQVDRTPRPLQLLVELQYRGAWFVQPKSGREWTVNAFLSEAGGLGLKVADSKATYAALSGARAKLTDLSLEELQRAAPLRADFFNGLVQPDVVRDLLLWLSSPQQIRDGMEEQVWEAFRAQCRSQFVLDPVSNSSIEFAEQLGRREALQWAAVWGRYSEAPDRYPGVADQLRAAKPKKPGRVPSPPDAWPQDNEDAEKILREALRGLEGRQHADAREAIIALEHEHGARRGWVWAQRGQAPLAAALAPLQELAELSARTLLGGTPADLADQYADWGWQVEDAALRALGAVDRQNDAAAVRAAVRAVYTEWLERTTAQFQRAVVAKGYEAPAVLTWQASTCVVFCDGLRLDLAHRLAGRLEAAGLVVALDTRLAALPSITGTAKPAVSPVAAELTGSTTLDPSVHESGSTVNIGVLRKQLEGAGYQVLLDDDLGEPAGNAWTETKDIDELGHKQASKLPGLVDRELHTIEQRVTALLEAGWQRVAIVTDHGWLLLPGDLPKVELPMAVADRDLRKGRCARLKPGAMTDMQVVPWHWDASVSIAVASGIACFQLGKEYEHGGLSLQECVIPVLTVTPRATATGVPTPTAHWRGLRCLVEAENAPAGTLADVRSKAGDGGSSVLEDGPKGLDADGKASLLVANDEHLEHAAFVVLLSPEGQVIAQVTTTIGGDS